jgi:hypothetical protein
MALYPESYLSELMELLRRARISIVSDPRTGPLHARVKRPPCRFRTIQVWPVDLPAVSRQASSAATAGDVIVDVENWA